MLEKKNILTFIGIGFLYWNVMKFQNLHTLPGTYGCFGG